MVERINEQLSAFMDDELPVEELELLASRLRQVPDYFATVARYDLIGDVIRSERGLVSGILLSAQRICEAVDKEPAHLTVAVRRGRWTGRQALAGAAIAASLTAVAMVSLTLLSPRNSTAPEPVAVPAAALRDEASLAVQAPAAPALVQDVSALASISPANQPGDDQPSTSPSRNDLAVLRGLPPRNAIPAARLTSYLVSHGEYAGTFSRKVMDAQIVNQPAEAATWGVIQEPQE